MDHNNITDNQEDRISITESTVKNLTVSYNDLERNYNGISLDSNGKEENINISSNKVANNCNGIYLGPHYFQSVTDYTGHNSIYDNTDWDINGRDTPEVYTSLRTSMGPIKA